MIVFAAYVTFFLKYLAGTFSARKCVTRPNTNAGQIVAALVWAKGRYPRPGKSKPGRLLPPARTSPRPGTFVVYIACVTLDT